MYITIEVLNDNVDDSDGFSLKEEGWLFTAKDMRGDKWDKLLQAKSSETEMAVIDW